MKQSGDLIDEILFQPDGGQHDLVCSPCSSQSEKHILQGRENPHIITDKRESFDHQMVCLRKQTKNTFQHRPEHIRKFDDGGTPTGFGLFDHL